QMAALGVVTGKGARAYDPAAPVTRDQMATFLVNAFQFVSGSTLTAGADRFTDDTGNTHETNINKAANGGLVNGTTATTYSPTNTVRRDQMASFLVNLINELIDSGHGTAAT